MRGWPMSLKFSLAIVLLVSSAMLLFGWVASSTTETRLRNEIINSGYGQVMALRGFAEKVMKPFQGERNENELTKKIYDYNKADTADKAFVLDFLDHQKRVYNVVIFASASAERQSHQTDCVAGARNHRLCAAQFRRFAYL